MKQPANVRVLKTETLNALICVFTWTFHWKWLLKCCFWAWCEGSIVCNLVHKCEKLFISQMLGNYYLILQCHSQTRILIHHMYKKKQKKTGQIAVAEDMWWIHQSPLPPSGQIKFVPPWAGSRDCARSGIDPAADEETDKWWRLRRAFSQNQLGILFLWWQILLLFSWCCSKMRNSWRIAES